MRRELDAEAAKNATANAQGQNGASLERWLQGDARPSLTRCLRVQQQTAQPPNLALSTASAAGASLALVWRSVRAYVLRTDAPRRSVILRPEARDQPGVLSGAKLGVVARKETGERPVTGPYTSFRVVAADAYGATREGADSSEYDWQLLACLSTPQRCMALRGGAWLPAYARRRIVRAAADAEAPAPPSGAAHVVFDDEVVELDVVRSR